MVLPDLSSEKPDYFFAGYQRTLNSYNWKSAEGKRMAALVKNDELAKKIDTYNRRALQHAESFGGKRNHRADQLITAGLSVQ